MKHHKGHCSDSSFSLCGVILLGPRIVCASIESTCAVIKETLFGCKSTCCHCNNNGCHNCGGKKHKHQKSCCDVPETPCPSACVAQICWHGGAGDTFHYKFNLVNTSKEEKLFSLEALPFGGSSDAASFDVKEKLLAPGAQFNSLMSFTVPTEFTGGDYQAKIVIKGMYEQYALINLSVKPNQDCLTVVEQGAIPTRIKAHHWYNHFQEEVECFKPIT